MSGEDFFFFIELGIMGRKKRILVVYIWKIKSAVNLISFKLKDLRNLMAYKDFFYIELGIMVILGRKKHILVVYIWKIKLAVKHILFCSNLKIWEISNGWYKRFVCFSVIYRFV